MDIISPTDAQRQEITNKRKLTERYLAGAFPISSTLPLERVILIGSAARGTNVRPIQDIDVMAEFVNKDNIFEQYRRDSGAFLQQISRALDAKTSLVTIGARGQALRLFYQSGPVDIAPVFASSTGGYGLPGGGAWITIDPEAQANWLVERKSQVGAYLPHLVKLARRWNDVHGHNFRSYHLEVVVCHVFGRVGTNWRKEVKFFFDHAPSFIPVSDPAGHSGRLDSYLTVDGLRAVESELSEAAQVAGRAVAAEGRGDHAEAKRLWRIEFGDEFPLG